MIVAIGKQIYCFRCLGICRIAPAKFISCSLPQSHSAVLGILLIRLWKPTVCKKQRWPNLKPDIQTIQLYKQQFDWFLILIKVPIWLAWNTYRHEWTTYWLTEALSEHSPQSLALTKCYFSFCKKITQQAIYCTVGDSGVCFDFYRSN